MLVVRRRLPLTLEFLISYFVGGSDSPGRVSVAIRAPAQHNQEQQPPQGAPRINAVTDCRTKNQVPKTGKPAVLAIPMLPFFHFVEHAASAQIVTFFAQNFGQLAIGLWRELVLTHKPLEADLAVFWPLCNSPIGKPIESEALRRPAFKIIDQ